MLSQPSDSSVQPRDGGVALPLVKTMTVAASGPKPLDFSALLLLTILTSFTAIAVQYAVQSFPPILGGVLRFGLAGLVIFVFLLWKKDLRPIARQDYKFLALLGLFCVPINQIAFFQGVAWANASHAAMMYANTPVIVTIMVCLRRIERWSAAVIAGAVLATVGVLTILIQSGLHLSGTYFRGDLMLLLATLTWSGYLVYSRPFNQRYGSLNCQLWVFAFGTLMSIPIAMPYALTLRWNAILPSAWAGLLYISIGIAVICFFLFNWSMTRQPPSRVATFSNAAYPLTLIWEAILTHSLPTVWFLLGSALLLTGMIFTLYRPHHVLDIPEESAPVGDPADL